MINKLIKTEDDYSLVLERIEQLMDSKPGSSEFDELELLSTLVEIYEDEHFQIDMPDPISAIKFRMEQLGLNQQGIVPYIGSRSKVSEVLNGKRPLTLTMMRSLHKDLGIPADVLLQNPNASFPVNIPELEWEKFPLAEMSHKGWIEAVKNIKERAEEIIRGLIEESGGLKTASAFLFRKGRSARENTKNDPYALNAWCLKVMAIANQNPLDTKFRNNAINKTFFREITKLSYFNNGPRIAKEYLEKHGIHLIILPHLNKTYLDGAAFLLTSGNPVIGLTLRYDRLDYFWFCLLHELAHIWKHLSVDKTNIIIDDLDLRGSRQINRDTQEREADKIVEEALIPNKVWSSLDLTGSVKPEVIKSIADKLKIHPSIIAGRIRYEKNNYKILSSLIGNRAVRKQFGI